MYLEIIKRIQTIPNIYTSYRPKIWSSWGWPSICLCSFAKKACHIWQAPFRFPWESISPVSQLNPRLSILDTISFVVGSYPHEKYPRYPNEKYQHTIIPMENIPRSIPMVMSLVLLLPWKTHQHRQDWTPPNCSFSECPYPQTLPEGYVRDAAGVQLKWREDSFTGAERWEWGNGIIVHSS